VVTNSLTVYEADGVPLTPPLAFAETYETGTYYSPYPDVEFVLLTAPSIIVPAGTFNGVLLSISLDSGFAANAMNATLGLNSLGITAAVTGIDWYAQGVGLVKYLDIDAATGAIGNSDIELISTSVVPEPATWSLMVLALAGIAAVACKRRPV
jgi:hypothetical protein